MKKPVELKLVPVSNCLVKTIPSTSMAQVAAAEEDPWAEDAACGAPKPMSFDERRQLAKDIEQLSPPDMAGLMLVLQNMAPLKSTRKELPTPGVSAFEAQASLAHARDRTMGDNSMLPVVAAEVAQPIQLECEFDLDTAEPAVLRHLRRYVDNCYIPHFVAKENCVICEGLWSSGRLIACGRDSCGTRVHEECFGAVLRQSEGESEGDGPWFCASCLLGRQLMCVVCMQYGGALKPLATGSTSGSLSLATASGTSVLEDQKWVHALCALAIPELIMRDVPSMEPVDGFEDIENGRFRYLCGICRKRGGASVICEHESCNVGMHPQCAANADLMIGNERNPLGVYCEKHLPAERIPGAKRWISDEDLVEEIISEASSLDEADEDQQPDSMETDHYAFILASTAGLFAQAKLLGPNATLKWGSHPASWAKRDLKSELYSGMRVNPIAWTVPGMVVMGMKTQQPLVFPPPAATHSERVGLPAFPQGPALVGAIVDYLVKDQDEWLRAQVVEWDTGRNMHLVHLTVSNQKLWATLTTQNTLVLYLGDEPNELDSMSVRLYRPVKKSTAEWRPKPRQFA